MSGMRRLALWVVTMVVLGANPITAQDGTAPGAGLTQAAMAPPQPREAAPAGQTPERVGSVTGFPIPRFVSIKASEAFARRGPSSAHQIDWVFTRRDQPVQVVAEYGHWRRVVDRDGEGGWMHYALLSGVRTGLVEVDMLPLRHRPDPAAPVRAMAERGVIAEIHECRPDWCRIGVSGYRGWVPNGTMWGVRPGEIFD